jgi:predicted Fe-Mo cluster-binding NifX family protein
LGFAGSSGKAQFVLGEILVKIAFPPDNGLKISRPFGRTKNYLIVQIKEDSLEHACDFISTAGGGAHHHHLLKSKDG